MESFNLLLLWIFGAIALAWFIPHHQSQEQARILQRSSYKHAYRSKKSVQHEGCDPSYPTLCLPPPPRTLTCSDIGQKNFPVSPPDPHNLDSDRDGVGCESQGERS